MSTSILLRASLLCLAAGALHGQVLVSLGASGCSALQGGQSCTLTARVTGSPNTTVTFSFSPTVPGATPGLPTNPDSTGLTTETYKAPNFVTARQTVTATATSVSDPTQAASVLISLIPPTITIQVTPSAVTLSNGQTQQFSALVSGVSQTGVTWSINPQVGSIDPVSGFYTAPSPITASQKVSVIATSNFDPLTTGTATITLQPPSIQVTPSAVTLAAGQIQQFSAVALGIQAGVTWSINPQVGSIDPSLGIYTAPPSINGTQKVTVTATSNVDATVTGTATVTLQGATITVSPSAVTLNSGQTQQFTATATGIQAGVTWSISPQVGSIDPNAGIYTAPSIAATASQKVTVTATSTVNPAITGTATVTLSPTAIQVSPAAVTLTSGQTQQFSAVVSGISQTGVTWSISPQVGSIDPNLGLYTAPASIGVTQKVTVTATSTFNPTLTGTATVTLQGATIQVTPPTVTLSAGQTQQFAAAANGGQPGVTWSISPQVGSIDPNLGLYTAPASVTAAQKITVTATSTANPAVIGTATITLQASPAISVSVTPATASLTAGQTQQFTATVQNSTMGVTWSLSTQVGFVDSTGLYTAPSTLTGTQKVTVTAISVEDPTKSGSATVTLTGAPAPTITVNPSSVTLSNGQQQAFSASVQNATGGVTWSISPQSGTIDTNGLYTAPAQVASTVKVTVTATLTSNPAVTGTATITLTTLVDVGIGAPGSLGQAFLTAFYRNGFNLLVSLPPVGNVKALGATGYVQEFSDAAKTSGVKLALATLSPTVTSAGGAVNLIAQLLSPLYVYYSSVGAGTAGYPLMDSQVCPNFDPSNSCAYDFFDKGYALFAYANALSTGQTFSIQATFYTEWTNQGGINGPGRPVTAQTTITASTTTTATAQTFASAGIYSITSGVNKGKIFSVVEPLYDLYVSQSGPSGTLGLPTAEVQQISSAGVYRQTFEGGSLQYTSSGGPTVELPVVAVSLSVPGGNTQTLNLGQTLSVTAQPSDSMGDALTDRPVSWSTTNGKVISIQAIGLSAVLTAVGGGTANVTASSGGVTSAKLSLMVISPCCQIGEGAPQSVQQAFQDAIARNQLSVEVPAPSAATRVGNGYVQMVPSSNPNSTVLYMLAQSDQVGTAYVVAGAILAQYQLLGGPGGALGYPIGDVTAGGTQLFAGSAALAGSPVRLVSAGILSKWALLGYEAGVAGPPVSDSSPFSTLGANSGSQQSFRGGVIYGATDGPRAGSSYYVSGLILGRFTALGGAAGDYGMPISDEFVTGSIHQQNFEGGSFTYAVGDTDAVEHPAPKAPGVIVAPASIAAGGQARLAIVGFPDNSTIRVSITGEPDFLVTSSNGAYSWAMSIPLSAKSGAVGIHAADTQGPSTAAGTLTIKGFSDNRLPIAKVQGDNQTGSPGATLPLSMRIALKDSSGSPVVGAQVVFQASPGAQLSMSTTVTDGSGQAETYVRLPGTAGVTVVTADAPSIAQSPVSFYALSAASSLSNFPQLTQAGNAILGHGTFTIAQKGALLTAAASILRYHQNRGELPAPNGTADPATLNQFLLNDCVVNPNGGPLCDGFLSNPASGEQVVNLWRAAEFTGGVDVTVLNPTTAGISDLVAQGTPVLLSLGLSLNSAAAGGHYVIATGISADGSIVIQDPNPLFARTNLNDYLNGFKVAGAAWKATLRGAVEFARRSPSGTRFMVGALSQPPALMANLAIDIESAAGSCGLPLDLPDAVDSAGNPAAGGLLSRIQVCDGLNPVYQISLGTAQPYHAFVTDLAPNGAMVDVSGNAPATYQASRPQLGLALAPQVISFQAAAVVNGATFTAGIAPGGIMAIFGSGLAVGQASLPVSSPGAPTTVDIDGTPVTVLAATPFQINAVVPSSITPGPHTLHVQSVFGSAQQSIVVSAIAPAIFLLGSPPAGAITNQDGTLNGPGNPANRGQVVVIYATGLGAVVTQGQLSNAATPVTVVLNGQELPAAFAGLAPGTAGEYQVNLLIPASFPPGLGISLTLKQGEQLSNTVTLALQ